MRKALLYLLLLAYTSIICKPILPTLADGIAHVFWYNEHMATVHYEHGKYHVHYEYQAAAKNNYPQKDTSLPKSDNLVPEHLPAAATAGKAVINTRADYALLPASFLFPSFVKPDFHPPRV